MNKLCLLCDREGDEAYFELHHLFPGKKRRKGINEETILVCQACGDAIHQQFTNTELRTTFNTLESLQAGMASFIQWVQKKPLQSSITMKTKKRKR